MSTESVAMRLDISTTEDADRDEEIAFELEGVKDCFIRGPRKIT
jgi:hypothetical protein